MRRFAKWYLNLATIFVNERRQKQKRAMGCFEINSSGFAGCFAYRSGASVSRGRANWLNTILDCSNEQH